MEKKKRLLIVGQTECLNMLGPEFPEALRTVREDLNASY